ncbi:MAG: UvrD-helicase domain-containing protein, partial [Nanoarchaeota archaeon]
REKWGSIFQRHLDLDKLKEYRELIIEEFPFFNINSWLVSYYQKINSFPLIEKLIREYDLIIVDEAQDTPDYILKYLFKLVDTDLLFLVGDPAQNIYFDLGYSEVFTNYDEENVVILKKIYRYSDNIKYKLLEKFPNFFLLRKVNSVTDYETVIKEINKKDFFRNLSKLSDYILIKNTNKPLSTKDIILLLLSKDIRMAINQLIDISYNWNKLKKCGLNIKFIKRWVTAVLNHSELITELLTKNKIYSSNEEREKERYFIIDLIDTLKIQLQENKANLDFVFNELKNLFEKFNKKPHILLTFRKVLVPFLFVNTYQSKGRSYDKVIYYNELGKYYLMKKESQDNLYWRFYHATLEYVAYTRVKKNLIIVE